MRLIIAGGRMYRFTKSDLDFLDKIHLEHAVSEVLCGGATGADEYGRLWAIDNNIPVVMFPANWEAWGRAAGPIRNREMAHEANAVVLFPGGVGTNSMALIAKEFGLTIFDQRMKGEAK